MKMMFPRYWLRLFLIFISLLPAISKADPTEIAILPLMKEKVCMSCHLMDKKRVGPSMNMIAERYADQGEAIVPILSERIQTGGKGHWGPIAMPAQPRVSHEEAEIMARWILSLEPELNALAQEQNQQAVQDHVHKEEGSAGAATNDPADDGVARDDAVIDGVARDGEKLHIE